MAKKAMLIILSFGVFFYIVSSGVDEDVTAAVKQSDIGYSTNTLDTSTSQYKNTNSNRKTKNQNKYSDDEGTQKEPTNLVLPPTADEQVEGGYGTGNDEKGERRYNNNFGSDEIDDNNTQQRRESNDQYLNLGESGSKGGEDLMERMRGDGDIMNRNGFSAEDEEENRASDSNDRGLGGFHNSFQDEENVDESESFRQIGVEHDGDNGDGNTGPSNDNNNSNQDRYREEASKDNSSADHFNTYRDSDAFPLQNNNSGNKRISDSEFGGGGDGGLHNRDGSESRKSVDMNGDNWSAEREAPPSRDNNVSGDNEGILRTHREDNRQQEDSEDGNNIRGGGLRGTSGKRMDNRDYNQFGRGEDEIHGEEKMNSQQQQYSEDRGAKSGDKSFDKFDNFVSQRDQYKDAETVSSDAGDDGDNDGAVQQVDSHGRKQDMNDSRDEDNIVFPKSSDVDNNAFYKNQDQLAIPRALPNSNSRDSASSDMDSSYKKGFRVNKDFRTNVSNDVKKYLHDHLSKEDSNGVLQQELEGGTDGNERFHDASEQKKVSGDNPYKKRLSTRVNTSSDHLGVEDLHSGAKRQPQTYEDNLDATYKHGSRANIVESKSGDIAEDHQAGTMKRTHAHKKHDEVGYGDTEKETSLIKDDASRDRKSSASENLTSETLRYSDTGKQSVGDNYPGSKVDVKLYAEFDKEHLLDGRDPDGRGSPDQTATVKDKHSTYKQFGDSKAPVDDSNSVDNNRYHFDSNNKASSMNNYQNKKSKHSMYKKSNDPVDGKSDNKDMNASDEDEDDSTETKYKNKLARVAEETESIFDQAEKVNSQSIDNKTPPSSGDISSNMKDYDLAATRNKFDATRGEDMEKVSNENNLARSGTSTQRYERLPDRDASEDRHVNLHQRSQNIRADEQRIDEAGASGDKIDKPSYAKDDASRDKIDESSYAKGGASGDSDMIDKPLYAKDDASRDESSYVQVDASSDKINESSYARDDAMNGRVITKDKYRDKSRETAGDKSATNKSGDMIDESAYPTKEKHSSDVETESLFTGSRLAQDRLTNDIDDSDKLDARTRLKDDEGRATASRRMKNSVHNEINYVKRSEDGDVLQGASSRQKMELSGDNDNVARYHSNKADVVDGVDSVENRKHFTDTHSKSIRASAKNSNSQDADSKNNHLNGITDIDDLSKEDSKGILQELDETNIVKVDDVEPLDKSEGSNRNSVSKDMKTNPNSDRSIKKSDDGSIEYKPSDSADSNSASHVAKTKFVEENSMTAENKISPLRDDNVNHIRQPAGRDKGPAKKENNSEDGYEKQKSSKSKDGVAEQEKTGLLKKFTVKKKDSDAEKAADADVVKEPVTEIALAGSRDVAVDSVKQGSADGQDTDERTAEAGASGDASEKLVEKSVLGRFGKKMKAETNVEEGDAKSSASDIDNESLDANDINDAEKAPTGSGEIVEKEGVELEEKSGLRGMFGKTKIAEQEQQQPDSADTDNVETENDNKNEADAADEGDPSTNLEKTSDIAKDDSEPEPKLDLHEDEENNTSIKQKKRKRYRDI